MDLGGKKLINGWLSVMNNVKSLNLIAPLDTLSNVEYVVGDAGERLPFGEAKFDVFISPVSLNLIGLGRYGDSINPWAIPDLILELERVMKDDGVLYVSVVLGEDEILFNHHLVMSFKTIAQLFSSWKIEDYLIDLQLSDQKGKDSRFTKDLNLVNTRYLANENIIFIKFTKIN